MLAISGAAFGCALIVAGIALWSIPAALVFGGICVATASTMFIEFADLKPKPRRFGQ